MFRIGLTEWNLGFFLIHLFPIKCTCFWQFSTLWLCNKVYNSTNPAYKKKEKRVLCNYQALRVFIIQWIFRCLRSKTFLKLEVIKTIMSVLFVPCFWRGGKFIFEMFNNIHLLILVLVTWRPHLFIKAHWGLSLPTTHPFDDIPHKK